jgi:hypothetical protein
MEALGDGQFSRLPRDGAARSPGISRGPAATMAVVSRDEARSLMGKLLAVFDAVLRHLDDSARNDFLHGARVGGPSTVAS